MTGFGKGTASSATRKFTAEIKSLNSKQLDFTMRAPSFMKEMEVECRSYVSSRLERGKVEMSLNVEQTGGEGSVSFNEAVLAQYKEQIEAMGQRLGIGAPQDWYTLLLRMPDAMRSDAAELNEDDLKACREAIKEAVEGLCDFRRAEGEKLYTFFVSKIEAIGNLLSQVDPYESERVPKIRARLEEQLEHLDSIDYDKGRIEQEMIYYIEKLDINEEKLRLRTHLNYFMETLGAPDSPADKGQGKKLGFIAQEMGREINTMGSKSNHAGMQRLVVEMKDELEQIKEQVLNVL